MRKTAIGIDVGGTGIKGAAIAATSGDRVTTRHKVLTPPGGRPEDIVREVADMVHAIREELTPQTALPGTCPVGVALPGVVRDGTVLTAANIDPSWIGVDAAALLSDSIGVPCAVLNDADAAGVSEAEFGAAKDLPGTTLVLTFGTGIGSAYMMGKTLVPNFELGHLHLDGHTDIEQHAAASAIAREGLTTDEWAKRVARFLRYLEKLFHPDRFVIGGGISKTAASFLPFEGVRTPVTPAHFLNDAGIVGAAWLAHQEAL